MRHFSGKCQKVSKQVILKGFVLIYEEYKKIILKKLWQVKDVAEGQVVSCVFVYGTLMTGMDNHAVIRPYIQSVQPGRVAGQLYHLPYGYPAYAVGPQDGWVYGELVELRDIPAALTALDALEDYRGPNCPENLYNRVIRTVIASDGKEVLAYIYEWNNRPPLTEIGVVIANGDWKRHV